MGKLPGAAGLLDRLPAIRAAGLLPGPHRDPFNRMLIAQTLFDAYGVKRLW